MLVYVDWEIGDDQSEAELYGYEIIEISHSDLDDIYSHALELKNGWLCVMPSDTRYSEHRRQVDLRDALVQHISEIADFLIKDIKILEPENEKETEREKELRAISTGSVYIPYWRDHQ